MILLIIFMIPQTVPFVKMEYYTRNTLEFWKTWRFFGGIHALQQTRKNMQDSAGEFGPEPAFFGNITENAIASFLTAFFYSLITITQKGVVILTIVVYNNM